MPDFVSISCVCAFVGPCDGDIVTDVRLVDGNNFREGRVEMLLNGTWGTVCDPVWTRNDAKVVCHLLGFGDAEDATARALFGSGRGPIHSHGIQCVGTEMDFCDCHFIDSGCNHADDVGVVCSKILNMNVFVFINRDYQNYRIYA